MRPNGKVEVAFSLIIDWLFDHPNNNTDKTNESNQIKSDKIQAGEQHKKLRDCCVIDWFQSFIDQTF